jgi:DNA-binding NtrC family response regulator
VPRTILIVTHHKRTLELLQSTLAGHGFPSEVAFDHDYALNHLRCFKHFCMFSEYGLADRCVPQMSPRHFLDASRALHPELLIVLLCERECAGAAKAEEGIHSVLEKPLNLDELNRTIQNIAAIPEEIIHGEVPRP